MIRTWQAELYDHTGRQETFTIRLYHRGDESGMIDCIRDEYGDTYFKRELYREEYIIREAEEGRCTFLTAEAQDGVIAGMTMLKQFYPQENICEVASVIIRKRYRGLGLSRLLFRFAMEILVEKKYSAAYCLPVLFHDVSQRLMYREGLKAVGFMLNLFDLGCVSHSYENGRNTKHSVGIQVRALEGKNAGTLYLPKEHEKLMKEIYKSLGVSCRVESGKGGKTMPDRGKVSYTRSAEQSSLEIYVHAIGKDTHGQVRELLGQFPLTGKQTANILLNCSDSHAAFLYRKLEKMGFFFTGVKPLCGVREEYMVLHHPGEVRIYFEDYVVSSEFAWLLEYVRKCCENRRTRDLDEKKKKYQPQNHCNASDGSIDRGANECGAGCLEPSKHEKHER